MLELSGKHSNMPILEGNKDVIWSKQTPLTEISENFQDERDWKETNILLK